MKTFSYFGINQALIGLSKVLLEEGVWRKTPGFQSENSLRCKELPYPALIEIRNPCSRHVLIPERNWNKILPYAESLWLALGSNTLDDIPGKYVKSLYNFSDDGETWRACLSGDTKIRLLDGTSPTVKSLIGKNEFWVFSKDKNGRVVPGRGHSARFTKTVNKYSIVTLDNGEKIKCTPDHLFRLKDGSYKEASSLNKDDSLSPLYLRNSEVLGYKDAGYVDVKDDSGEWALLHRRIGEFIENKVSLDEKPQIHHKDSDKLNNSPENIEWLSNKDHRRVHAIEAQMIKKEKMKDPEFRELNRKNSINNAMKANEKIKKLLNSSDGDYIRKSRSNNARKLNSNPSIIEKQEEGGYLRLIEKIINLGLEVNKHNYENNRNSKAGVPCWEKFLEYFSSKEKAIEIMNDRYNHRIESIEIVETTLDVYDISVDEYHNFALDSGVFVHNSYGPRIRYYNGDTDQYRISIQNEIPDGVDQLKYVIETLKSDPNSRQALITIHDPIKDSILGLKTKDQPCTRSLHFMKHPENNSLNCYVTMRSNDLLWGFSAVNVFNFTWMLEYVSEELKMEVGSYYHIAHNLHFYENFQSSLEKISSIKMDSDILNYDVLQNFKWKSAKLDNDRRKNIISCFSAFPIILEHERASRKEEADLHFLSQVDKLPFIYKWWALQFWFKNKKKETIDFVMETQSEKFINLFLFIHEEAFDYDKF